VAGQKGGFKVTRKNQEKESRQCQLQIVREAVDAQRVSIDSKRKKAKRIFVWITTLQLLFLAATPVFLGLSSMDTFNWYTVIAFILTACALLTGSLLATFSFRERWRNFARVSGDLQELRLDGKILDFYGDSLTLCQLLEYRHKFQAALSAGNEKWDDVVGRRTGTNA
jgi:hypothetical protein